MWSPARRSDCAAPRRWPGARLRRVARAGAAAEGFTLIEALVAVAVLAVVLAAVGSVVATIVRGVRSAETKLPLIETAQALMASLPARDALQPGTQTGVRAGYRWRLDVTPLAAPAPSEPSIFAPPTTATNTPKWALYAVTLRVQGREGPPVRLETVRLAPARVAP